MDFIESPDSDPGAVGRKWREIESLTAVKGRDIIQAANGKESVLEFNLTQAQAKKLGQTENILLGKLRQQIIKKWLLLQMRNYRST